MGGKTYLFDLIQQCTYINKFMALPVSSSIVSYLSPGLDNNQLPLQWKEVSVTLNGAVMSFASCCASLWRRCLLGLFVWPVGSHLVWMMAAVRVPLASVTPTMAAWSHAAYSASCSGCAALQRAWRIAAEVSTSLARTMQNAARVSATSATAMEDRGKQQLGAAGCLNCGCIGSDWVSVTSVSLDALCGPLLPLHRLTDCGESDSGDQSSFDCSVQRLITLVESAGWAEARDEHNNNKCDWLPLQRTRLS